MWCGMMMTIHARMIKISSKPAAYSDVQTICWSALWLTNISFGLCLPVSIISEIVLGIISSSYGGVTCQMSHLPMVVSIFSVMTVRQWGSLSWHHILPSHFYQCSWTRILRFTQLIWLINVCEGDQAASVPGPQMTRLGSVKRNWFAESPAWRWVAVVIW